MNPFNQQILAAKKKQRLLYSQVITCFIIGILIVLALLLVSRGSRIEVHPNDAAKSASIRLKKGIAFIIGKTLYSISKQPAITVSAEGFKSLIQVLNQKDFGNIISITLKPLPARLELGTNINNDKTSWLINDRVINISALFKHELAADDYNLRVTHPHFNDVSLALSLVRGELLKETLLLTPIDGSVTINTIPKGVLIKIGEINKGLTPLTIPLQGGMHKISLSLNNYQSITPTIEINRTHPTLKLDYKLEPKKAAINVSLTPLGGQLFLDNIIINKTQKIPVSKGVKHRLSYSKPGFFKQNKTVTLNSDESINLAFSLKKEMGLVEINATPVAEVELNGKSMGSTPLQLSLQAIQQKITLHKKGYRRLSKLITPSSKKTQKINITLDSEKLARLKEAPKFYTHKAGGTLKLFTPNETFTIGASRSERGQRANEFIKKITLNKAFYAGITEVTNDEYRRYNKGKTGAASEPVTSISWIDAAEFCNWLSRLEGLNSVYRIKQKQLISINANTDGYRLLTEAEWEWLARKSGKSIQTRFVWGNENIIPKNTANIADELSQGSVKVFVTHYNDGFQGIAPVKSFTQEKSGLYDQGGNVSEWTHNSYSIMLPKSGKVFTNPFDLAINHTHVVKGANWRSGSITELRPSFKEGLVKPRDDLGFRIGRYVYGAN